jgi:N-acetylmuramoyl-L-alanine amidase
MGQGTPDPDEAPAMIDTPDHPELRQTLREMTPRVVLGLTLWGEARGESVAGRVAVAWVIKNRSKAWQTSIADVCLSPGQFSCWNPGNDANHREVMARAALVMTGKIPADANWLETLRIADDVLGGRMSDPTNGALYYCTLAYLNDGTASRDWFRRQVSKGRLRATGAIGAHMFFRDATDEDQA